MIITTVSLKVGYTYNMGDYSNIRPEVMLSAEVLPNEPLQHVFDSLKEDVLAQCYDIIDSALEADEKCAKFSTAPRCNGYVFHDEGCVVLLGKGKSLLFEKDAILPRASRTFKDFRFAALNKLLAKHYPTYTSYVNEIPDLQVHHYIQTRGLAPECSCLLYGYEDLPVFLRFLENRFQETRFQSDKKFKKWVKNIAEKHEIIAVNLQEPGWEQLPVIQNLQKLYEEYKQEKENEDEVNEIPFEEEDE